MNNDKVDQENYSEQLKDREERLSQHTKQQARIQRDLYPGLNEIYNYLVSRHTRIWERRPGDPDFLSLRDGIGSLPNSMVITPPNPDRKAPYLEQALNLVKNYTWVRNVPCTIELEKIAFLGVSGHYSQTIPFVRALLCHLAFHHSPNDVKVLAVYSPKREEEWAWLGWLPHCRLETTKGQEMPMVASQTDQFEWLMNFLLEETKRRQLKREQGGGTFNLNGGSSGQAVKSFLPRLVLVVDDYELVRNEAALIKLFEQGSSVGIYLMSLSERVENVPTQCRAKAELLPDGFLRYGIIGPNGQASIVTPDLANQMYGETFVLSMTPLKPQVASTKGELNASVRLLEMLGINVQSGQTFDPLNWWQRSQLSQTAQLRVPIGRLFGGQEMQLDLSDKQDGHGPHGLIAGTTGSGKSEIIQTIICSLAMNNHPDQLNFILGDFKGGATISPFAELPHVVGMITNEDLTLVERAMTSLLAEKSRRERLLHEEGVTHIREYQRKKPQPAVPLPYLIVIIDEFAEMKEQAPDFILNLISIARTGRTLGIHLLLATQRPSGVISPQLNSNTRFRICLRVETNEDSQEMLGRRDAAEIASNAPGRAYFRVGSDIYETFQGARVAEEFVQSAATLEKQVSEILVIEPSWRTSPLVGGRQTEGASADDEKDTVVPKDFDVITRQCIAAAKRTQIRNIHRPWLDPLAKAYYLPDLLPNTPSFDEETGRWPEFKQDYGQSLPGSIDILATTIPGYTPNHTYGQAPLGLIDNVTEQKRDVWKADLAPTR